MDSRDIEAWWTKNGPAISRLVRGVINRFINGVLLLIVVVVVAIAQSAEFMWTRRQMIITRIQKVADGLLRAVGYLLMAAGALAGILVLAIYLNEPGVPMGAAAPSNTPVPTRSDVVVVPTATPTLVTLQPVTITLVVNIVNNVSPTATPEALPIYPVRWVLPENPEIQHLDNIVWIVGCNGLSHLVEEGDTLSTLYDSPEVSRLYWPNRESWIIRTAEVNRLEDRNLIIAGSYLCFPDS